MTAAWPFGDLVPFKYQVILADPPWRFDNWSEKGEAKNPNQHYACMSIGTRTGGGMKRTMPLRL